MLPYWSCKSTLLAVFSILLSGASAQYVLIDRYTPQNFFDKFTFWTSVDPTNGYVQYVDRAVAQANKLIANTSDRIYMGVDITNTYDVWGPGRPSVRIQSNNEYNHGLFILDLNHIPWGCGAWPAWWTVGNLTSWPADGEIDIIEGVNTNTNNTNKVYTSPGCSITGNGQTAIADSFDCNTGCGSASMNSLSFGEGFNSNDGGVYAMEWTSSWIRVWFFPRSSIPNSITFNQPDPSRDFGIPLANFQGSCNIDQHFKNHKIVFDITFCGDWAGPTFGSYPTCPLTTGLDSWDSCKEYVATNPQDFTETYWDINSLNVYMQISPSSSTAAAVPTSLSTVSLSLSLAASSSSYSLALGKGAGVTSSIPYVSPDIPSTAPLSSNTAFSGQSAIQQAETSVTYSSALLSSPSASIHVSATGPVFTPAPTQPCSPITQYNGPHAGFRTGIGDKAGGQTMCQRSCDALSGCTDYLYVHYLPDSGSPLGYWDCWFGGVQISQAVCASGARKEKRQAYTTSPNSQRTNDYQVYEVLAEYVQSSGSSLITTSSAVPFSTSGLSSSSSSLYLGIPFLTYGTTITTGFTLNIFSSSTSTTSSSSSSRTSSSSSSTTSVVYYTGPIAPVPSASTAGGVVTVTITPLPTTITVTVVVAPSTLYRTTATVTAPVQCSGSV